MSTCGPVAGGGPTTRVSPLAEPNEAMAFEAQMEEWFIPARENPDASRPWEERGPGSPDRTVPFAEGSMARGADVRCPPIERTGRVWG